MVDINAQGSLLSCRSLERASRSIRCLPFTKQFYQDAQERGLDASTVLQLPKLYRLDSVRWFTAANSVEDAFRWLIRVGVLRREVDGQGLTSRIRATPLARQLLEAKPDLPQERGRLLDHLRLTLRRCWPTL